MRERMIREVVGGNNDNILSHHQQDEQERSLGSWDFHQYIFWDNNSTDSSNSTDFDSNLVPAEDVSVDAVVTSLYFNTIVFICLMLLYEGMRRLLPTVYSRRKRIDVISGGRTQSNSHQEDGGEGSTAGGSSGEEAEDAQQQEQQSTSYPQDSLHSGGLASGGGDYGEANPSSTSNSTDANDNGNNNNNNNAAGAHEPFRGSYGQLFSERASMASLPDDRPLDWIRPVVGVPWSKVRRIAGLDGYFFLRYIRMNVRITAVTTFWFFLVLVPVYASGGNPNNVAHGWYHISAVNIPATGWRMWIAILSAYLFSAFIAFVIKQEYRHFLELRQDFLARGSAHVHPQHHYSLMVEAIPYELRSDRALADYFDQLFPGRIHSASLILKTPDLEEASMRCKRTCTRLEKSIAQLHATGRRPSHIVGRGRLKVLGVELPPLDCSENPLSCIPSDGPDAVVMSEQDARQETKIPKGTRVDSISYYTLELAQHSQTLLQLQQRKLEKAESGNQVIQAQNWLDRMVRDVGIVATQIMDQSMQDNALIAPKNSDNFDAASNSGHDNNNNDDIIDPRLRMRGMMIQKAEGMTSKYGSFSPATLESYAATQQGRYVTEDKTTRLITSDYERMDADGNTSTSTTATQQQQQQRQGIRFEQDNDGNGQENADDISERLYPTPFGRTQYHTALRRWGGRLGLDFLVAGMRFINGQVDVTLEGVMGTTMSSTGFVTFLDLASTTCAASAPLTVKSHLLQVQVAPEPREIQWQNAHVSARTQSRREVTSNFVLFVGVILWSFPLAAIQAFAKAEFLARIPGMEWILTFHGGRLTSFVNGYLPVCALLGLIVILPVIFEQIAVRYEKRKTFSDIQASMLTRYFYYQLANIYVSVTAGSILKELADILDHPSNVLDLLSESLPTMVGYFVALLVTKTMAGLPMIFLRFGALSRMVLLRTLSSAEKLTQRELDWVYRLENVQYGWEFPTQLLVVVIVFTYAIICPVILPFGLVYFLGALVVYKKQVLYVYSPVYESGGSLFPLAVQRSLFGLVCGQMTFLGYLFTRGAQYQPLALFPLPILTIWVMQHFHQAYVVPSTRLSLERAREYDLKSNGRAMATEEFDASVPESEYGVESRRRSFDKNSYRQPVLTQLPNKPWMYRRGQKDEETVLVRRQLRRISRLSTPTQSTPDAERPQQQQPQTRNAGLEPMGGGAAHADPLPPPPIV